MTCDETSSQNLGSRIEDRALGCLLGLAVGDALGTTVEFEPPGTFKPLDDMIGGGPFGLTAGEWTDDTSMALCLATSLIEKRGFDPGDQMEQYCLWHNVGFMSSTGICFDIGGTVKQALDSYQVSLNPYSGPTQTFTAGNGSIMRLAPIPMFYHEAGEAIEYSGKSSQTTHGATTCVDACRYFGGLLWGAIHGFSKEELLSDMFSPLKDGWVGHPLCPEIAEIAAGSFKVRQAPEIRGTGYVVKSLEAALWAFFNSHDFRTGCLLAVNLGDDADTTAAVYGQLAGAYYGLSAIPEEWRSKIKYHDRIIDLARKLAQRSEI